MGKKGKATKRPKGLTARRTFALIPLVKLLPVLVLASCALLVPVITGCSSLPKTVAALEKNPASVHVHLETLYGWLEYDREMPSNQIPYQVSH